MTIKLKELASSMNDFVFSVKIPSTGDVITGKPYTIRDEFKMAQIQNTVDKKSMLSIIFEMIKEKFYSMTSRQVDELTMLDIQWLLVSLKINSDEPQIPIIITCASCAKKFDHDLFLNELSIDKDEFKKTIKIENEKLSKPLSITLTVTPFKQLMTQFDIDEDKFTSTDDMRSVISNCIDSIAYGDEMSKISDFEKDDLDFFIENIPRKYFLEIKDFIDNPPKLIFEKKVKCTDCQHLNKISINDFFHLFF